jgi:nucleoside-diphosphate-sugar epimerase
MGKQILITGITGFIGSHIAAVFLENGDRVTGLKRSQSDTWRNTAYADKIHWINIDDKGWQEQVIQVKPDIIIHGAWEGVAADNRQHWVTQWKNLDLLSELLLIARESGTQKFIGLGSQAEYGYFDGVIDETYPCNPNSAYGVSKLMAKEAVKCFCEQHDIQWYWLRLFPCFGEKESFDWLIPMLTRKIYRKELMEMTPGEQRYAYLYVKDLSSWIVSIAKEELSSGIYNISSQTSYSLKEVVKKITGLLGSGEANIRLGALPYRQHQPMLLAGNVQKLFNGLGGLKESNFDEKLQATVTYIIQHIQA